MEKFNHPSHNVSVDYSALCNEFIHRYNAEPRIFRSPGRINIIGEHTDYNEGFVMPAAINRQITLLMAPSANNRSCIFMADTDEEVTFSESDYDQVTNPSARFVIGVYDQLLQQGLQVPAVNCLVSGNIPMGAGLSSSAALECAALMAYRNLFNLDFDRKQLALWAQKAENEFVGVQCGIMDQFASVFSKKKQVLKLDCRDLSYRYFPMETGEYEWLLVDSMVKHSLASSEYNVRRQQCETGVRLLRDAGLQVTSLRDVSAGQLEQHKSVMDEVVYRRCRYVINENRRVRLAGEALENNDLNTLGTLMYESHDGLQHEYEVSCDEIDFLVDYTRDKAYVLGSRLMGGGFGGCTINLIKRSAAESFRKEIKNSFERQFGRPASIYGFQTADGTSELRREQFFK